MATLTQCDICKSIIEGAYLNITIKADATHPQLSNESALRPI